MQLAFYIIAGLVLLFNTAILMCFAGLAVYVYKKQPLIKLDNLFQLMTTLKRDIRELPGKMPTQPAFPVATSIEDLDKQEFSFILQELLDQGMSHAQASQRANEILFEKIGKHLDGGSNPYDHEGY